jgi:excisionase family DNA binding protein
MVKSGKEHHVLVMKGGRLNMWLPLRSGRVYLTVLTPIRGCTVVLAETLNTNEAAKKLGVHRSTLPRWFAQKRISEVRRDRNNWRVLRVQDLQRIEKEVGRDAAGSER